MRQFIFRVVVSMLSLYAVASASTSQEDLLRTRDAVWRAWFNNDQGMLHRLVPPGTIVIAAGEPVWRSQASVFQSAAQFKAHGGKLLRLRFPRTEVQRFGDVAIVYSSYLIEAEVHGKRTVSSGRATEVFVWRKGMWINPGWHTDVERVG